VSADSDLVKVLEAAIAVNVILMLPVLANHGVVE